MRVTAARLWPEEAVPLPDGVGAGREAGHEQHEGRGDDPHAEGHEVANVGRGGQRLRVADDAAEQHRPDHGEAGRDEL